jgi:D-alanyl-D-alanine dipeptidase
MMHNLIEITPQEFGVILDVRYASTNNVCEQEMYSQPRMYLHQKAAELLKKAVLSADKLGFKLKLFDGFRPMAIQRFMFEFFAFDKAKSAFFSDPNNGAVPHCRGVAIDLTLTDKNGKELDMGSDFDELSSLAFHDCNEVSDVAAKNRKILLEIMTGAGFDFYSKEWWHYQLFDPRQYPVVDKQI